MSLPFWIFLGGFAVFFISSTYQIYQIFSNPNFTDPSQPKRRNSAGITYSFTGAMSPFKKESAFLHYPTYVAGILFHLGTFLSFLLVLGYFLNLIIPQTGPTLISYFLIITALCGAGILVKRIANLKIKSGSTPDDYFSNVVVTLFQILSAAALSRPNIIPYWIGYTGMLFLYIPISKLRHSIYFFFARAYLGIFYGKRGVWPPRKQPA
ncbi:MAG: hypothetical protein ACHQQQ_01885 [Bacteroidota bacterium]